MKPLSTFSLILRDVRSGLFLRDIFCEFLGTVLFVFISLSSVLLWPHAGPLSWDSITDEPLPTLDSSLACSPDPLHVSLAFGVSLILTSVCLGGVHLNPVVTLALVAGLRVSPWRAVLLVGAQLLGALSACALLLDITPTALKSNLGVNEVRCAGFYRFLLICLQQGFLTLALRVHFPTEFSADLDQTYLTVTFK